MKRYYFIFVFIFLISLVNVAFCFSSDEDDYIMIFKSKPRLSAREIEERSPVYEHNYDVHHYKLVQNIDVSNRKIVASTYITLESKVNGLSEVNFDFFGMTIDGVYRDGIGLTYSINEEDEYINIVLDRSFNTGEIFTIQIDYNGTPVEGLKFSSNYAYTLTEPDGAHYWFPCYDDPSDKADSSETIITVPEDYYVASNGKLVEITHDQTNKTKTFHWFESYPIAMYLISICCYPYTIIEDQYHSMPLLGYVAPELKDKAIISLSHQDDMLECYFQRFGIEFPYLSEKYSNAGVPMSGGMENQTCTAMGNIFFNGYNNYDWIFAHESAHSWWGNSVTCGTWKDIWLNEGFATYSDALFAEWFSGWDAFYARMQSFKQAYFSEDAKHRYSIYDPEDMWNATVYEKGAWVLHMLRHVMGDDKFFAMINDYGETYKYKTAITSEFEEKARDHYGSDLKWFFDEWVYKAGYPQYEWEWWQEDILEKSAGKLHIKLVQVQKVDEKTPIFKMPIDFRLIRENGDEVIVLWNDQKEQEFVIDYSEKVSDIQFDSYGWLLCKFREGIGMELTEFKLDEVEGGIKIDWSVVGDDGGHFNLYRREQKIIKKDAERFEVGTNISAIWNKVNESPIKGRGDYSYIDRDVKVNTSYEYKLEYVLGNETSDLITGSIIYKGTPGSFFVSSAYPNPFSDEVKFDIGVNETGRVIVKIYDIAGRFIRKLSDKLMTPGTYSLIWDGRIEKGDYVKSGQYIISFELGDMRFIRKVIFERY
ncbi:MAG: M1 family aminopeptidase [bacterium]